MTKVQEIESAIQELSAQDTKELSAWWDEHIASKFDAELQRGIQAGVFDSLVEEALAEQKAGRTLSLPSA